MTGTTDPKYKHALPFFSVDTLEQADDFIALVGKRGYDNEMRVFPWKPQEIDELYRLSEMAEEWWQNKNSTGSKVPSGPALAAGGNTPKT